MLNRIIVLGDSYTYGHGCIDRIFYHDEEKNEIVGSPLSGAPPSKYCWAELLKKDYQDIEVFNLAQPGRGNPSMFRDLTSYFKSASSGIKTLVIFCASSCDRIEVAGNTPPDSWVVGHNWDPAWADQSLLTPQHQRYFLAQEMYTIHLYDKSIGQNIALMSILGAKEYSNLMGFQFVCSIPETYYDRNILNNLKETSMKNYCIKDIQSYFYRKVDDMYRCKDYHTNELGHKVYYEKIIKPFIEIKINE